MGEELVPADRLECLASVNGLRYGATAEACRARWHEFELGGEMPHYRPAAHKTARHGIERLVPLNADALAAIGGGMRLRGDAFVFTHTRGEPFTPNALLLAVRRAIAATGCADWSPYGLRHLAATTALARTGSEAASNSPSCAGP